MASKVAVIDTSLLCCWLKVPGVETAGSGDDEWDFERTNQEIDRTVADGYLLVFPFTTLIETGNHISHSPHHRREHAIALVEILRLALNEERPWAAYSRQAQGESDAELFNTVKTWPDKAAAGVSLGDHLITRVVDNYSSAGFEVKILTSDSGLRSYESPRQARVPRRRG